MIEQFDLPVDPTAPLPDFVLAFLARVDERQDDIARAGLNGELPAFVSSDHPLVYLGLRALLRHGLIEESFLEWGSGLGAVTGLAALLGYEAHGIEVEPSLVDASRELLEEAELEAVIVQGSFLPPAYDPPVELLDPSVQTILPGAPAYDELELDPDDFGVIFSFPWPGQVGVHYDVFDRYAAPGAILMTYQGIEELVFHRKLA